jgi:uncharacterized RDD family membrane protein YckC
LQPGVAAVDPAALHARAPAQAEHRPVYAGFWRRAAAVVLDSLVLYFPLATLRVLSGLDLMGEWSPDSLTWWILSWIEVAVAWLYGALMISGPARGTLGLQILDLQVCGLQGQRVSFLRATWRYFAQVLTLLSLGIGYVMQVFSPRRQTLHDLVSATVVVRARPAPAPAPPAAPAWGSAP